MLRQCSPVRSIFRNSLIILAVVFAACSTPQPASSPPDSLPVFDTDAFSQRLERSDRPTVINVWASWCIPCRSEAPLLAAAHERFGDEVDFIGVAIEDTETDASAFIAEFGITYENYLDRPADVWGLLGGRGVPITYFVAPGGEVVSRHFGVIDEAALALGIDELARRGG